MAGMDTEFQGEAWVAEGATVGYLSQEPELDPDKDVRGNVMDGVAHKQAIDQRADVLGRQGAAQGAEAVAGKDAGLWAARGQEAPGHGRIAIQVAFFIRNLLIRNLGADFQISSPENRHSQRHSQTPK